MGREDRAVFGEGRARRKGQQLVAREISGKRRQSGGFSDLPKYRDLQVRLDRMAESLRIAGANCGSGRAMPILDSRGRISAVSAVQAVDLLEGACGDDLGCDAKFCSLNAPVI